MVSQKILVKNASGLHMRPAGIFVKEASKFDSNVFFEAKGEVYNAKSMLNVLSASVKCGDEIELKVDGEDEAACLASIVSLIESGLGE